MAQLKVGDRVSSKRLGCRRGYGTVVDVIDLASEPGVTWVRVKWDHGPVCWWEPGKLKAENVKAR